MNGLRLIAAGGFGALLWIGVIGASNSIGAEEERGGSRKPASTAAESESLKGLQQLLERPLLSSSQALLQVQEYCERRVREMPEVSTVEEWERYSTDLRSRVLKEVVLRGEAAQWAELPTVPEWLDTIETSHGYRIRKLRYEAVPGMWIPALLYEPTNLKGKAPVFMNVNGHDSAGKVAGYKQARCINLAKRGMIVLNVEWVGMGQLRSADFNHYRMNQLDLCGTSGIAPFYLSMKRGLDILLEHESADSSRVGVAGLSGGGWQTIFISGLDTRVTLSNPVAGYSSYKTRARVVSDLGDSEQTPSDLAGMIDYTHLTAMRAPRATLLSNNDRDRCCFAAGHALPPLMAAARPIYKLHQVPDNLWVHINHVPGTHNFEQDNREALYRFIAAQFYAGEEFDTREIPCETEFLSKGELDVPLPEVNKGFHTLALELARNLPITATQGDPADPIAQRGLLAKILRLQPGEITSEVTSHLGQWEEARVTGRLLRMGDDWSIPAVDITPPQAANQGMQTVLFLCDGGRRIASQRIAELVHSGHRVIAIDPFFFGESRVPTHDFLYGLLIASTGNRPLGVQVDQVVAAAEYFAGQTPDETFVIETRGRRTGLIAMLAAAIHPHRFESLTLDGSFQSLQEILNEDLAVNEAPELFCFGLLKHFDIPQIESLSLPCKYQRRPERSKEPEPVK